MSLTDRILKVLGPLLWRGQSFLWQLTGAQVIGVKVMLLRDGHVLLVRQTYRRGWFLPGGGLKRGETIADGGRREAWEEVGARVGDVELIGLYTHVHGRVTNHLAVLATDSFQTEHREHWEIAEARYFPVHALPRGLAAGDRHCIERHVAGETRLLGRW